MDIPGPDVYSSAFLENVPRRPLGQPSILWTTDGGVYGGFVQILYSKTLVSSVPTLTKSISIY